MTHYQVQREETKAVRRNLFLGGGGEIITIFEGKSKRGSEATERGESGSFCIFEIEIERSRAHFGWNFWEIFH